jgi:hypothetical protein
MPYQRNIQHRGDARPSNEHDHVHQQSRQERSGAHTNRGTSRIGPAPTREARTHEGAGQSRDRAPGRDPDCWGRLQLILSRLIGGRG